MVFFKNERREFMKKFFISFIVLFLLVLTVSFGQQYQLEQLNQAKAKLDFMEELSDRLSDMGNHTASRYLYGKEMAIKEFFINVYGHLINTTDSRVLRDTYVRIKNMYIEEYNLMLDLYNLLKEVDNRGSQHVLAGYNDAKSILDAGGWEGLEDYQEYVRRVGR